jgi:hypothetical protein
MPRIQRNAAGARTYMGSTAAQWVMWWMNHTTIHEWAVECAPQVVDGEGPWSTHEWIAYWQNDVVATHNGNPLTYWHEWMSRWMVEVERREMNAGYENENDGDDGMVQ